MIPPDSCQNSVPNYVPAGFDAWLANGGGDYLSPEFSVWNVDGLPNSTYPKVCTALVVLLPIFFY